MFRIERSRVNISGVRELQVTVLSRETASAAPVESGVQQTLAFPSECETAQTGATELLEIAQRDADGIVRQAQELLSKAQADAEALKAEAQHLGFEQGYENGSAEGMTRFNALMAEHKETFSTVLSELKRAGDTMVSDMEDDIVDLCFSILRKITAFDRANDGDIFKSIIKKSISQVDMTGKVTIRLSHEDFERFYPDGKAIIEINDTEITAAVVSDPEFSGGDIAVDTDSETVLAGAETQLRNIEFSFRHHLGNAL